MGEIEREREDTYKRVHWKKKVICLARASMVLFSLGEINKNIPGNFERSLTSNTLYQHLCKPPSPQVAQARIRIPFNPTFRTFRWYIKWNGIYIWSDRNIRDQLWRWSTLTGLVGPNWQNWKLLSSVPFFCIQLTRTITKRAAAWVGSVQQECNWMYRSIYLGEWNFRNFIPEFLLNGKPPCMPLV